MTTVRIDLSQLAGDGGVKNLSGKERGVAARAELNLDKYDSDENEIVIVVPAYIDAISPSYFQGLFSSSIKKLTKDGFRKKYRFDATDIVMRWVELGMRNATSSRAPLV